MVFDWATSGPYEGGTVTFIEEYRGYSIYFVTGPGNLYGFVDPTGVELSQWRSTLADARAYVDGELGPPEEPDIDPTAKTLIGPYRGIDIYKFTATGYFWFYYAGEEYTIEYWNAVIGNIDALLGPAVLPDEYVTTWGGFGIYMRAIDNKFYVMVDGVPEGEFSFLADAQEYIENVLGFDPSGDPFTPGDDPDYTPMDKDPVRAAAISGPVQAFLSSVGLTPEALDAVRGSGADPEKAAQYAKSVSLASVGAVAILGTIGVVAEVASLGQVEGVTATIDMVLEKTGISGLMNELFRLPFMSALVTPAHHYWNSVYTPEIPGSGDLITFLVREIITPDEFNKTMALQGFSQKWADDYWEAHWRLPSIGDIIRAEHRGLISKAERDIYFVLHDYRSDNRPGISVSDLSIYGGLTKTLLGRVDTRRAYQYGIKSRADLIEMYLAQGYEEDSEIQADIQIRASVDGLQSAIRRETGMIFRDRLKDAREDESAAVGSVLRERDAEILVIALRLGTEGMEEVDLMLIPDEYKDRAAALGPLSAEEAAILEADLRARAEAAIAEVRAAARAREVEAEEVYRAALVEVGGLIDPIDLWVMRYKLAAARVEVAEEFEIEPPTLVSETFEEPE